MRSFFLAAALASIVSTTALAQVPGTLSPNAPVNPGANNPGGGVNPVPPVIPPVLPPTNSGGGGIAPAPTPPAVPAPAPTACPNGYTPKCAAGGCTGGDVQPGMAPGYLAGKDIYVTLDDNDDGPTQGTQYSLFFAGEFKNHHTCTTHPIYELKLRTPCRIVTRAGTAVPEINKTVLVRKRMTLWGEGISLLRGDQEINGNKVKTFLEIKGDEFGTYAKRRIFMAAPRPNSDAYRGTAVVATRGAHPVFATRNCPADQ